MVDWFALVPEARSGSLADQLVSDLNPTHTYRRALRRWYLVFAAGLLGGLIGLLSSGLTPPKYLATAVLDVGIDYARSRWIDQGAELIVHGEVQELLLSDRTLVELRERAAEGGYLADPEVSVGSLRDQLRLVRIDSSWYLSALTDSPSHAAGIANAWAEVALVEVQAAVSSAAWASELQALYFDVACRPEPMDDGALWVCGYIDLESSSIDLEQELFDAVTESRGLVPAMTYGLAQRAEAPTAAFIGNRSTLAAGGMLMGLIVGAAGAVLWPDRKAPDQKLDQT